MSVDHLAPRIRQILSAPDTDLSTVSAKRVRKQLVELDPEITLDFVKQNKDAIDALIGSIFEGMNNPDAGVGVGVQPAHTVTANANGNGKRKREEDDGQNGADQLDERHDTEGEEERVSDDDEDEDEDEQESRSPATPVPKKQRKGKPQELTDEEYARQLSSELNQRPARGGRNTNGTSKKGASRTPKKVKKSRAQIDDDSDIEENGKGEGSAQKRKRSKPAKKTGEGGGAKGGFAKEFALSEPLAVVIDTPQLSRPQVVKKLWEYIKQHDLQNPKNKKEILCDDNLRAVFNLDKIDMFAMNKVLGQHLYELES